MNFYLITLLVITVIFASTIFRAAFGFGNALLAMPVLVLIIGAKNAAALIALVGTIIAAAMLFQDWKKIAFKDTLLLLLFSLAGVPIGLVFLKTAPETAIRVILGFVLVGFGLLNMVGWQPPKVTAEIWVFPFGFIAGILGGAYNANGPPVVLYGLTRGWDRDTFRTTLQGYFLVTNIAILIGHGVSGLWNQEVIQFFLFSIPAAVLAVYLGKKAISHTSEDKFRKALYLFIVIVGSLMFI